MDGSLNGGGYPPVDHDTEKSDLFWGGIAGKYELSIERQNVRRIRQSVPVLQT